MFKQIHFNLQKRKRERNEKQNELIHETKMLEVYAQDLRNLNESKSADANRKIESERKLNEYKMEAKRFNSNLREVSSKLNDSIPEIQHLKTRLKNLENETEQKMQVNIFIEKSNDCNLIGFTFDSLHYILKNIFSLTKK